MKTWAILDGEGSGEEKRFRVDGETMRNLDRSASQTCDQGLRPTLTNRYSTGKVGFAGIFTWSPYSFLKL